MAWLRVASCVASCKVIGRGNGRRLGLRKLIYSLIWQSVMLRPGKLRFLIGVKNPLPIRPAGTARKHGPLRGRAGRQIRDFSRATPSFCHEPGDIFSP